MISLEKWNSNIVWDTDFETKNVPNNIACPECGSELFDVNRMEILASNPPQYEVRCLKCGFHGYRYR